MGGLVFVPLSGDELSAWAGSGQLAGPRPGFAVTPAMLAAFGLAEGEDAEYTALCIAGIAGLLAHGERLVAVVEAPVSAGDDEFGQVEVSDLPWSAVGSLFAEDGSDSAPVAVAVEAVMGSDLARAWEAAEVEALLAETDLLWYGPSEWVLLGGWGGAAGASPTRDVP